MASLIIFKKWISSIFKSNSVMSNWPHVRPSKYRLIWRYIRWLKYFILSGYFSRFSKWRLLYFHSFLYILLWENFIHYFIPQRSIRIDLIILVSLKYPISPLIQISWLIWLCLKVNVKHFRIKKLYCTNLSCFSSLTFKLLISWSKWSKFFFKDNFLFFYSWS